MNDIVLGFIIYYAGILATFALVAVKTSREEPEMDDSAVALGTVLLVVLWPIYLAIFVLIVLLRGVRILKNVLT